VQIGCTICADALHSLCGWLAQFVRMRCTKSADEMHKICTSVEKAVDNFVENPVDNYLLIHQSADEEAELWISTVLSHQFMKVFHYFYRKKDINLLTLHRKQELWISHVTC